jgi:hypothetical protein
MDSRKESSTFRIARAVYGPHNADASLLTKEDRVCSSSLKSEGLRKKEIVQEGQGRRLTPSAISLSHCFVLQY